MIYLYFNFFGGFSVCSSASGEKKTVTDEMIPSFKMWAMLEYLVINRKRKITSEELIDMLWSNQDIADPTNALKALLFRIRQIFCKLGIENFKTVIACKQRTFIWSENVEIKTDIESFENIYKKINADSQSINDENLHSLMDIYKGDILPQMICLSWINNLNIYYHSQFLKLCKAILKSLYEDKKYDMCIYLSNYVITIEQYDEWIFRYNILSLADSGNAKQAIKQYNNVKKSFLDYLGEPPTSIITDIYKDITKHLKPQTYNTMDEIENDLSENESENKAYYCEYSVFRDIYRLKTRSLERTGLADVAIFVIKILNYDTIKDNKARLAKELSELVDFIRTNLRKEDILTKLGDCRFLIMLSDTDSSSNDIVLKRILGNYKKFHHTSKLSLTYSKPKRKINMQL